MEVESLPRTRSIGARSQISDASRPDSAEEHYQREKTGEIVKSDEEDHRRASTFFPARMFDREQLPAAQSGLDAVAVAAFQKLKQSAKGQDDDDRESIASELDIVFSWDHRLAGVDLRAESSRGKSHLSFADFGEEITGVETDVGRRSKLLSATAAAAAKRKSMMMAGKKSMRPDDAMAFLAAGGAVKELSGEQVAALFREELSRATKFYSQRQFKRAIQSFSKALELRSGDKQCLVDRAKCYIHLGMSNEALKDAEASLATDSEFPRGLYFKAEALYQMGKFEMALVFYHRGNHLRPEMTEFRVGIKKAEEAINNTIGTSLKSLEDVPKDLEENEDSARRRRLPPAKSCPPRRSTNAAALKSKPKSAVEDRIAKQLLGQLYKDKEFLAGLLREEETRPQRLKHIKTKRSAVHSLCKDGLVFLRNRTEFWRQQKPVSQEAKERRESACRTVEDQRDLYLKKLAEIDSCFQQGDTENAFLMARKLEGQVLKEHEVSFRFKPEILAWLYHFIGNLHLDRSEFDSAVESFLKERIYGEGCDLPAAKSRSFDDLGRAYVKLGDFNAAIDIFKQKLQNLECSNLERIWLNHEIARCFYELGNISAALDYACKAMEIVQSGPSSEACDPYYRYRRNCDPDQRKWLINVNLLLAQCYVQIDDAASLEKASFHFQKAQHLVNDDPVSMELRQTISRALEQVSKRLHLVKQLDLLTTLRITVQLGGLDYEPKHHGEAFITFTDSFGFKTRYISLGTFRKFDAPRSVELYAETTMRKSSNSMELDFELADLWIDGCRPVFSVQVLVVVDDKTGKRWHFATNGSWVPREDDPTKRAWRMLVKPSQDY